jgi:GNAT superfamily N-acetyltransferase
VSAGVVIRRATVDDIEEMLPLRMAMQREFRTFGHAARGVADPEAFVSTNRSYFERKLPTGEFVAIVAEEQGRIVATSGMVVYEAPPTPGNPSGVQGYVINMYTLPEHRGQGLARALLDELIAHAKSLGARRVWLRTSEMGRSLYRAAGFFEDEDYMRMAIEELE